LRLQQLEVGKVLRATSEPLHVGESGARNDDERPLGELDFDRVVQQPGE
jgi:hypothetical protein